MNLTAPVVLLDSGPWMALHCRGDTFHAWARGQFAQLTQPLLTCEAVVAETCFLLAHGGHDPAKALALMAGRLCAEKQKHHPEVAFFYFNERASAALIQALFWARPYTLPQAPTYAILRRRNASKARPAPIMA